MNIGYLLAILAFVCLSSSVFSAEDDQANYIPKRSNRLQLLNKVVKARLLAGKSEDKSNKKDYAKPVYYDGGYNQDSSSNQAAQSQLRLQEEQQIQYQQQQQIQIQKQLQSQEQQQQQYLQYQQEKAQQSLQNKLEQKQQYAQKAVEQQQMSKQLDHQIAAKQYEQQQVLQNLNKQAEQQYGQKVSEQQQMHQQIQKQAEQQYGQKVVEHEQVKQQMTKQLEQQITQKQKEEQALQQSMNKQVEQQAYQKQADMQSLQVQMSKQLEQQKELVEQNISYDNDGAYTGNSKTVASISAPASSDSSYSQQTPSQNDGKSYYMPNPSMFQPLPKPVQSMQKPFLSGSMQYNPSQAPPQAPLPAHFLPTLNAYQTIQAPSNPYNPPQAVTAYQQVRSPLMNPAYNGLNSPYLAPPKFQGMPTINNTTTMTTSTTAQTPTTTPTTTPTIAYTTPATLTSGTPAQLCANKRHGDLVAHPTNKNQFMVCHRPGVYTVMDCPPRLLFNPHLERCDVDLKPPPLACLSNPCLNDGNCVDLPKYKYKCECEVGFYGTRCEKKDYCTPSPCGDKGVCIPLSNNADVHYYCSCFNNQKIGYDCDKNVEKNPCLMPYTEADNHFPSQLRKDAFIHCDGKIPHLKLCHNQLVFSESKKECDWDE